MKISKADSALLLGLVVFLFSLTFILPINENAYKWDSAIYISWVRDFPNILNQNLNPYHFQKILPASMVNLIMRVFNVELSDQSILKTFQLFNIACICTAGYFWLILLKSVKNFSSKVLSLILLFTLIPFFNFITHPANIDTLALCLSTLMLWSYWNKYVWVTFLLAIPASITWPSLVYVGALFFLFPREISKPLNLVHKSTYWLRSIAICFVLLFLLFLIFDNNYISWCFPANFGDYTPILWKVVPISIIGILIYVWYFFSEFKDQRIIFIYYSSVNQFITISFLIRILLLASVIVAIKFGIGFFSSDSEVNVVSGKRILASTFVLPLIFPFSTFLSHFIWFGPLYIFFLIFYKRLSKFLLNRTGVSGFLVLGLLIIFSINIESRYSLNLIIFLLFAASIIILPGLRKSHLFMLGSLQLVYTIITPLIIGVFYQSSHQLNGPWISHFHFILSLPFFITLWIIFYKVFSLKKLNYST